MHTHRGNPRKSGLTMAPPRRSRMNGLVQLRRTTGSLVGAAVLAALLLLPGSAFAVQAVIDSDTYINSTSTSTKNTNYGGATSLRIASGMTSFLRFDFSTLPGGTTASQVQKATLSFFVSSVTTAGSFDINRVNGNWTELGVAFNNYTLGLSSTTVPTQPIGSGDANNFVTIDVTDLVKSWINGTFTNFGLALVSVTGTNFTLHSKETSGGHPAWIEVALGGSSATGPTGP